MSLGGGFDEAGDRWPVTMMVHLLNINLARRRWDDRRLENNVNLAIRGVQGETVLLSLDMQGVAASAGSACTTGNSEPSHVLLAMGLTADEARGTVRFSLSRFTTEEEVERTVALVREIVPRARMTRVHV